MRPGASGSPGITSSSPVKKRPSRTLRYTGSVLMPTDAASPVSCGSSRLPAASTWPPLRMSLPVRRIHSPGFGRVFILYRLFSASVNSCMTMASAPGGTGAPVNMRAAVPVSSGVPTDPAGMRWAILNFAFAAETSESRIA